MNFNPTLGKMGCGPYQKRLLALTGASKDCPKTFEIDQLTADSLIL